MDTMNAGPLFSAPFSSNPISRLLLLCIVPCSPSFSPANLLLRASTLQVMTVRTQQAGNLLCSFPWDQQSSGGSCSVLLVEWEGLTPKLGHWKSAPEDGVLSYYILVRRVFVWHEASRKAATGSFVGGGKRCRGDGEIKIKVYEFLIYLANIK